ncbi:alpha/beta-hydrolase [Mollisia scopiformis]|uniref:Carboxylic ester hydrolase n=1 Tax=Mollisia scopiformis TaxID=149040 RepID=A0A194XMN1_MOLSC|nr:alpha/beta-hydrolase [Mollisia scopiformis]KUJ21349.1 alpha/beta-hydrolase [Mollisia scopiformis]
MMRTFTVFTALSLQLVWAAPQFIQGECDNFTIGQTVETSSGSVTGHASSTYSEVSEYLGIPYAYPPVGDLRFAAPVKYTGSSALNGSTYGPSCPLLPSANGTAPTAANIAASNVTEVGLELIEILTSEVLVHSEDCLYMNVWSKPQSGEELKAVMVFIYGGAFDSGTSSSPQLDGAGLADMGDVVVVSFNYRFSILGFPGDPNTQRNVAFLDQRLAMEWVRDNIANFGGDTSRITLFGQSAGSASTDYYSYAWASDPIVTGIILESGTVFSFDLPYASNDSAAVWYNVSTTVGCGNASTDPTELMACMQSVELDTLMAAVPQTGLYSLISAFGPTVDNTLVFANYSEQTPASIPVLDGSNDYEAGLFRTELAMSGEFLPDIDWDLYNLASFTCPAGTRANASVAAGNPTWRYRFFGVFPNTNVSAEGGAYHGAELPILFGTTFSPPNSTAEELIFQKYLIGAWTTFAKDPVNGLLTYEGGWPLYDPNEATLVRLAYDDNFTSPNLALPMQYDVECPDVSLAALIAALLG